MIREEVIRKLSKRLDYIQRGGRVNRMHMIPTIHAQNVAAHSFGVAWWCWLLMHEKPSANLLMAAIDHDLPEGTTGDIPAPTKHRLGLHAALLEMEQELSEKAGIPVFELTEEEETALKLADNFELLQHCIRERTLGNRSFELTEMWSNVFTYVEPHIVTSFHKEVAQFLLHQWRSIV